MTLIIGVPKETLPNERRVALIPATAGRLAEKGLELWVQSGAGVASGHSDSDYRSAKANIAPDLTTLLGRARALVMVQHPTPEQIAALGAGGVVIGMLQPHANPELIRALAKGRITAFSLDLMPRITRAQSMDVLSSMSTLAGYRSVLIAACALPKLFPLLMTAAGTLKPARVLVIGAGVAGLQAIATARRLGAVVEAFDIRSAAKEQVESLGARFVEDASPSEDQEAAGGYAKEQSAQQLERQRALLSKHLAESDVVICTALVPGRKAPTLVTTDQVQGMRSGSVIVDLAAEQGGNCEATVAGQVVVVDGVEIHGPENVASCLPVHASQMFSQNLYGFISHLTREGELVLDLQDELTRGPLVTHDGAIVNDAVRAAVEG